MNIGIVGAGGIGGLLAGFLLEHGHTVYLSARGEHAAALRKNGLKLELKERTILKTPTAVLTDDDLSLFSKCEIIIVAVKMYDLESVCITLKPHVKPGTALVTMQNGVDALSVVSKYFGVQNAVGGSIITSARIESPGVIVHAEMDAKVTIENKNDQVREFASALKSSGVPCELSDDIQAVLWKKLIRLASISGVTCLMRQPFVWIRKNPEADQFLRGLITEAYNVGVSFGVTLPPETIKISYDGLIARGFDDFKPSMLLDLERGKRLEVKYLSGAVSRMGKGKNIPTPCSDAVAVALAPYENGIN